MARPRKAQLEGAVSAGPDGEALTRIVEHFAAEFPTEWEALRLCPLAYGLEDMARLLK